MDKDIKKITDCLLYHKMYQYTEKIMTAIKTGTRIEKNTQEFTEDIALVLKRTKMPAYLLRVLTSKNTVLLLPTDALPRPVRVVCAKDPKDRKIKVFIDCTGVITQNESTKRYNVKETILLAYLISAKTNMVYYNIPGFFSNKSAYTLGCSTIFAQLFTHLIDYIGNISIVPENRTKTMYYSAKYFLMNVMRLDEDKATSIAMKVSKATETNVNVYDMTSSDDSFTGLDKFITFIGTTFKMEKLSLNLVVEKWMFLYGSSTVLSLEFLPAFISMITDAYCGAYLNNQKSIEKVVNKNLAVFGKEVIYDNIGIK